MPFNMANAHERLKTNQLNELKTEVISDRSQRNPGSTCIRFLKKRRK